MGWFWADAPAATPAAAPTRTRVHDPRRAWQHDDNGAAPPHGCPMHKRTVDALSSSARPSSCPVDHGTKPASCPVDHGAKPSSCPVDHKSIPASCPVGHGTRASVGAPAEDAAGAAAPPSSFLSQINPLNYMFRDLSQDRAPNQRYALPTSREESSIPKGPLPEAGKWEYPSPQQMYNALLRKGYTDTDVTAVETMVAVHNFLNEGAWTEILEWEKRFGGGLARGWEICRRGETNADETARKLDATAAAGNGESADGFTPPSLLRFQGRPKDMTPKAAMIQVMGWLYPSKFGTEPPFDRHDWYVARTTNGKTREVRYVIDYYSGPPEPTGEPVFYLDVRPAITPTGAAERLIRWGGDVWWRASGGEARETNIQTNREARS